MNSRELTTKRGALPDLSQLCGEEVIAVEFQDEDRSLKLTLRCGDSLIVPAPWQFSSCLLALSSAQFESKNTAPESVADLVGLCSAHLTSVESDGNHLDLIFGSIRISVTDTSQLNS